MTPAEEIRAAADITLITDRTPVRYLWPADRKERGPLGTMAVNTLRRNGILTVGDVMAMTARDITDLRSAGAGTLAEVRRALAAHGLGLAREPEGS
jgi:DNA-directed RNA polymerase alpha subunit